MQKKKILELKLPVPSIIPPNDKGVLMAEMIEISGKPHVIADLYYGAVRFIRYAVNETEAARYIYDKGRWSRALSTNIDIKGNQSYWACNSEFYCKPSVKSKDKNAVTELLKCKPERIYYSILERIDDEQARKNKIEATKEADETAKNMALLEELNMNETILKDWQDINRISYRVKGSKAHFICLQCGKEYDKKIINPHSTSIYPVGISRPTRGEKAACKECGCEGVLFPQGRFYGSYSERWHYVWQKIPDGIVCRIFYTSRENRLGGCMKIEIVECIREFFRLGNYRLYSFNRYRWHKANSDYGWCPGQGKVYGNPIDLGADTLFKYISYDEILSRTGKREYFARWKDSIKRENLKEICKHPEIEYYIKIGMEDIAARLLYGYGAGLRPNARKLADKLQVNPERVKSIKESHGDRNVLALYQWERKAGVRIEEENEWIYKELCRTYNGLINLESILKYMTLTHLKNQLVKYQKEDSRSISEIIIEYKDYLQLREELEYDMSNSVYLNPRNLKQAHQKMVLEKEERKNNKRLSEVHEKYPRIMERYKSLDKKYHFEYEGYVIRPAQSAEEIVQEGWNLHHCVGGNNYLDKHNTGKTSILMMRLAKEPDIPYVTIEIDKHGEVLQWYGEHDRKDVTDEALICIEAFIEKMKPKKKRSA